MNQEPSISTTAGSCITGGAAPVHPTASDTTDSSNLSPSQHHYSTAATPATTRRTLSRQPHYPRTTQTAGL